MCVFPKCVCVFPKCVCVLVLPSVCAFLFQGVRFFSKMYVSFPWSAFLFMVCVSFPWCAFVPEVCVSVPQVCVSFMVWFFHGVFLSRCVYACVSFKMCVCVCFFQGV